MTRATAPTTAPVARRRGAARVIAAATLAGLLLLLDVSPALADTGTPSLPTAAQLRQMLAAPGARLRVPGSVLSGASRDATVIDRVAGVRASAAAGAQGVTLVPSSAVTDASAPFRKLGATVGGATSVVGTFLVGTQIGTGIAQALGLPTSGSFFCDLGTALGTSDCAVGPAPEYDPNSDVGADPDGWQPASAEWSVTGGNGYTSASGVVHLSVLVDLDGSHPVAVSSQTQLRLTNETLPAGFSVAGLLRCLYMDAAGKVQLCQQASGYISVPLTLTGTVPVGGTFLRWEAVDTSVSGYGAYVLRYADYSAAAKAAVKVVYFAPGTAERPASPDPNPARTWRTTWSCTSGPGGVASSAVFHEGDASWPAVPQATCPAGLVASESVVEVNGQSGAATTVYTWTLPAEVSTFTAAYPQCGNAACTLDLARVDATTGARVSCFDQPEACAQWAADPAKTADYVCTYGGADVALDECNAYQPLFDVARASAAGLTYGDPETGETPEGAADGGGTAPSSDASCGDAPAFEFSLGGIGYWIAHGTQWALCEAFNPGPQTWPDLSNKAPVPEVRSALVAVGSLSDVGTSCLVLPLSVGGTHVTVLDSCGDSPAMVWLRDHRDLAGALLMLGLAVPLVWWAFRTYAPGSQGNG